MMRQPEATVDNDPVSRLPSARIFAPFLPQRQAAAPANLSTSQSIVESHGGALTLHESARPHRAPHAGAMPRGAHHEAALPTPCRFSHESHPKPQDADRRPARPLGSLAPARRRARWRHGLARLAAKTGLKTTVSGDGEEALLLLEKEPADILISDVMMPNMNGLDLLRQIRARWPDTAVILITGFGTIEMAVECLQHGASHFIPKPFDNRDILDAVERVGSSILAARAGNRTTGSVAPEPGRGLLRRIRP